MVVGHLNKDNNMRVDGDKVSFRWQVRANLAHYSTRRLAAYRYYYTYPY